MQIYFKTHFIMRYFQLKFLRNLLYSPLSNKFSFNENMSLCVRLGVMVKDRSGESTMRDGKRSIPGNVIFFTGVEMFQFLKQCKYIKNTFYSAVFCILSWIKLVQRILWFYTIYRIIYFALKRKMLFHGLRPFFWPIPFKTREFILIMNLKCVLHACAGKTVQHHAKILLGQHHAKILLG